MTFRPDDDTNPAGTPGSTRGDVAGAPKRWDSPRVIRGTLGTLDEAESAPIAGPDAIFAAS